MARALGPASAYDPSCKIICLALLSSSVLGAAWPLASLVIASAMLLLLAEGLSIGRILRETSFVLAFAAIAAILRFIADTSLAPGVIVGATVLYALRLAAVFLIGRLFYASTRISELRDGASRITGRIPFLRSLDLGLLLSMILCFIPLIIEEWKSSMEAAHSRGMPSRPKLGKQVIFLIAFLRRLMLYSVTLPEALFARGWTKDRHIPAADWKAKESLTLGICGIALAATVLRIV